MATFRKIHVTFWSDSFISELSTEKKLFYIYLLTNEKTTQCGIYETTKKKIAFDLGYSIDTVSKLLQYFEKQGKILYSEKTNEILLLNWKKFNSSVSPKVKSLIEKEITMIKNTELIQYIYNTDTVSIQYKTWYGQEEEEEEEEEEEKEKEIEGEKIDFYPFEEFWNDYDKKVGEKVKLKAKYDKLKDSEKQAIKIYIPQYKKMQEKKFRKNPQTFLNNKSWNDELIQYKNEEVAEKPKKPINTAFPSETEDDYAFRQSLQITEFERLSVPLDVLRQAHKEGRIQTK